MAERRGKGRDVQKLFAGCGIRVRDPLYSVHRRAIKEELVAVGVILVTATIIGVFVRTWEDFRRMALTWVGASVLVEDHVRRTDCGAAALWSE